MIHLVSQSLSLAFMADLGDRSVEICVCDLNALIRNWGFVFVDLLRVSPNMHFDFVSTSCEFVFVI